MDYLISLSSEGIIKKTTLLEKIGKSTMHYVSGVMLKEFLLK